MKVLITRPRTQSGAFGAALQLAGFEPVYFPVIEIRAVEDLSALDVALAALERYAWVVFSSVNGVEIFFNHWAGTQHASPLPGNVKFAAVGKKTAEALRQRGIEPFFMPDEFIGEAILPGLGDLNEKWVLLPRAEIARKDLPRAILLAGGVAHEIAIYRTLPAEVEAEGFDALKKGVDWLTFTSPSTVQNFSQIARQNGLDPYKLRGSPKVACIGPITEKAAREAGFTVDVVADEYTTEGLIKSMLGLGESHVERS